MASDPTPFVESNLLLAVASGDDSEADRLIRLMLPGERRRLIDDADRMIDLLNRADRGIHGPPTTREAPDGVR